MAIYPRGDTGILWIDLTHEGKRIRQSTKTKDLKLAEKLHKQLETQLWQDTYNPRSTQLFLKDAIERVYRESWQHAKSGSLLYKNGLVCLGILGNIPVNQINHNSGQVIVDHMRSDSSTNATINRKLASLSKVMSSCVKWEVIDKTIKFPYQKEPIGRVKVISEKELNLIIDYFKSVDNQTMIDLVNFLANTGVRLGEAIKLNETSIDLTSRVVYLRDTKNGTDRVQPLNKHAFNVLRDNPRGFCITQQQANYFWSSMRAKIGKDQDKEFVMHALRHTAASKLVDKDVNPWLIKEFLGHKDIKTTQKYLHMDKNKLREAANLLCD